jgi:hypothetical protein
MVEKKSVISNAPAMLAATGGLITAIVGLLSFMSAPAPTIVAFDASPNIITIGESSILKWSVTGDGATVTIGPDIGIVGLSGTREVAPSITTNYTLTAKNKDQEKIASVLLVVREKNESIQVINDVVGGIVAKSDVPISPDVKAEQDQKQNEIYEPLPEAKESINPDEFAIVPDSDSQDDTVVPPAQMVVKTSNPLEAAAIDQPGMKQNAKVASVSAIVPDTAAKFDTVSELTTPKTSAAEANDSGSSSYVESGLTQPRKMDETPAIATYNNESYSDANSRLDTGSDDIGVTDPKSVKKITAADWDSLNNISGSETDFPSNAPIYTKLGGASHTPANSPDSQDPTVTDSGFAGPDYLSADIQSQVSSRGDTELSGAS